MFTYTKSEKYGDKCIHYVGSTGQEWRLFYESDDVLGQLLHNDDRFAQLTIHANEAMNGSEVVQFTVYNNDHKKCFDALRNYVQSIKCPSMNIGAWNVV